jgi:hypothetical protein
MLHVSHYIVLRYKTICWHELLLPLIFSFSQQSLYISQSTMTEQIVPQLGISNILAFYFSKCQDDDDTYKFVKCTRLFKQKKARGYSNLKAHLMSCVGPEYKQELQNLLDECKDKYSCTHATHSLPITAAQFLYSKKENDVDGWIDWVDMRNQPLSEVDDERTRRGSARQPIFSNHFERIC